MVHKKYAKYYTCCTHYTVVQQMAKLTDKHVITDTLYVFKQVRSTRWHARFKLDEWYSKSTKEKELNEAIVKAIQLQTEYRIMLSNNIPVHTSRKLQKHTFDAIADLAIERMEADYKPAYKRLIAAIKQYHKPYFGKYTIKEINADTLKEFDQHRIKELRRVPAKDTVKDHNAALQRVFDEAVIRKYITQTELPELINTGRNKERRAAFSRSEYDTIVKACKVWIDEVPQKKSKAIRETLYYYIQIAALTGLRTGTEMEQLEWRDLNRMEAKSESYMTLTVRKGKTTAYTGTREIICKDELQVIMDDYADIVFENAEVGVNVLKQKMFNLDIGSDVFGKNFTKLLRKLDMQQDAHGRRTLYSLRHSYVTWELQNGTPIPVIASNAGTSPEMIERFYSHVVPRMHAHQLSGRE